MNSVATKRKTLPRKRLQRIPQWRQRQAGGLRILEAPQFAQLNWLVHGFSTRPGGASELESDHDGRKETEKVLNLGFTEWDTRERVLENRHNFFAALNASDMCQIGMRSRLFIPDGAARSSASLKRRLGACRWNLGHALRM